MQTSEKTVRLARELSLPTTSISDLDDLQFMAQYKYNGYEMFLPGMRFMDQLALWLSQFRPEDRPTALELVRHRLVFVSQREMQELAHFLYYSKIVPEIMATAMDREGLGPFGHRRAFDEHLANYLRSSLFIGLSDGSRIDFFRRHHIQLSQDQVIPYYRASHVDYLYALRRDTAQPDAYFHHVFLIDDFTASGYTLAHAGQDGTTDGSLSRLYQEHHAVIDRADKIIIAYYIASDQAMEHVMGCVNRMPGYRGKTTFIAAMRLGNENILDRDAKAESLDARIMRLCDRYYKEEYENSNTRKGVNIKYGFGESGLMIVTHSNTPNNSIFPLWLDRDGSETAPQFVPLFRRIDRHRLG